MNVLFIISSLSSMAGTERAVINLINILLSKQINVTVLCLYKDTGSFAYKINGNMVVKYLGLRQIPKIITAKIFWYFRLFRLLKSKVYDEKNSLIISVGHNISFLIPLIIKHKSNTKLIAWEHINFNTIPKLSKFFVSLTYRKFNYVVVLTEYQKKLMHGINENIVVIPNSLSFLCANPAKLENKRIIMVGRLAPEKGFDRVFDIANYIEEKHPDWKIHIYGDGDLLDSLINTRKELGLENIIFFEKPVKNIKEKYLNSSILMMTSYTEVMPMVLLEAMSCGVPVIAYNDAGIDNFIENDKNGYQIKSNDLNSYCQKLSLLITDIDKRKELGKNAKAYSTQFSTENIALLWRNLLN